MRKKTKQILCTALSVVMLLGILPMQALAAPAVDVGGMITPQQVSDSAAETPPEPGMTVEPETEPTPGPSADPDAAPPAEEPPVKVTDSGTQPPEAEGNPEEEPPAEPDIGEPDEEKPSEEPKDDGPIHWLQQYQQAALEASRNPMPRSRSNKASAGSPSYSMIEWSGGNLEFANGAFLGSPMPKIYMDGEIAFCAEWNGQPPSGNYVQSGEGSDPAIKQILANYDNSGKSNADYAAAQAAIWAHIMGTSVSSWGGCPGSSSADEILNGSHDTSSLKYNYISWTGGTQDLITYNTEEEPDPKPDIDPDDYPEDEYRIEVETDTQTETEVRNRKTYEYSDAIGQITIRKHDQDEKSLDGALFDIDVAFSDGTHTTVENWEVDNGARLFTWTHPKDNHDPATVTVTEVRPPHGYEMDPTPQTAVVAPTYTRVTHVETWTVTIVTETTSSTVIEIASGEVVAESESSSSAETESDPQVEEFTDFIEGDRETTMTFVNTAMPCSLTVYKYETGKKAVALQGASFRIRYADPHVSAQVWTQATDQNGEIRISLPCEGALIIEELSAPDGYVMGAKTTYDVTVAKGEHKVVDIPNDKKSTLTIEKVDSMTLQPLDGVVFEISIKNGKSLGQFTTDASGRIIVESLEPGQIYEVREVRALPGYLLDETVHEIRLDENENPVLKLKNIPEHPILIEKRDSITGDPIPDTTFLVTHSDGRLVGEFTTGENGMATVTGKDVVPGWYLIKETRANPAYIASGETKLIELKYEAPAVVEFLNKPRTGLQIRKMDSVTGEPIPDVGFYIEEIDGRAIGTFYTDEAGVINLPDQEEIWVRVTEIKPADGYKPDPTPKTMQLESGKLNVMEWRNQPWPTLKIVKLDAQTKQPMEGVKIRVYDKFHREAGTFTTNRLGEILLSGIDGGETLYLQEVETLPGYQLDETVHEVTLQWGKTSTVELLNKPLSTLRLLKIDSETKEPIYGAVFNLYDVRNNLLGEFTTDQNGVIEFPRELAEGKYKLKEVKCDGYVVDSTIRTIEVKSGETTELTVENRPMRGQIQIVKKASADNPVTKEKAGALLEGAEFTIYNDKLEVVDTITTDSRGVATSKPLPLATYAIKETASPEYYLRDEKVFYATLKIHNDLVRFEVLNQPADVHVTVEKRGNMEVLAGDVMSYSFSNIRNDSNVALEEFYWRDMLPDEVRLGKIVTGTWSERLTYSIEYKTNRKNSWRTLEDGLSSKVSYTLDCGRENLKLAADEYVTEFRFRFGTVQPGFCEETGPAIFVTTLANLKDGYRIVNRTDAGGRTGEEWVIGKDSWITVVWNKDRGNLPKTGI
ncbi:SpaA isopeptide-forming pilin-related protein [Anaerotruncus colihominis]|uniref:MSCRAMM family protein n=1 Tax=Anaerotruncus colihominis TaxID=169435 RepID=UPI0035158F0E